MNLFQKKNYVFEKYDSKSLPKADWLFYVGKAQLLDTLCPFKITINVKFVQRIYWSTKEIAL